MEVILGALANANSRVTEFRASPCGRVGYGPAVPPHEGIWQAINGAGMIPWNRPNPARTTTWRLVPRLEARPSRGSKFFHCVFRALEGQVSPFQPIPPVAVSRPVARPLYST